MIPSLVLSGLEGGSTAYWSLCESTTETMGYISRCWKGADFYVSHSCHKERLCTVADFVRWWALESMRAGEETNRGSYSNCMITSEEQSHPLHLSCDGKAHGSRWLKEKRAAKSTPDQSQHNVNRTSGLAVRSISFQGLPVTRVE